MRRGLAALLVAVTAVAVPAQVSAVRSTIGFELVAPMRLLDTRSSGSINSGVESALPATVGDIVNLTLLDSTQPSWLYIHPCGTPPDRSSPAANVVYPGGQWTNMVPVRAGDSCMTLFGDADVIIDLIAREAQPSGLSYVAHPQPIELDVALAVPGITRVSALDGSVPSSAEVVAVWVTVFAGDAAGLLRSADCATGEPALSGQSVFASAGGVGANLVLLEPDANGDICFRADSLPPESVEIERWGYLAPGVTPTAEGLPYSGFVEQMLPGYTALTPSRLFDTRDGGAAVAGGQVWRHTFTGLPAETTAVAINLTVTQTTAPGFVSAYRCEADAPDVSNVNFTGADLTVPNFAIVAIGPSHELCFYASATTHLLADLSGYFAVGLGDGYVPQQPIRVFDTRTTGTPVQPGGTYVADLSAYGARSAAVLNVTVTQPDAPGFVTVYPCDAGAPPQASNLNFMAGQTRANMVTVRVPADGRVCFYSSARVHLLVDLAGGYSSTSEIGFAEDTPYRVFDTREPPNSEPIEGGLEHSFSLGVDFIRAVAWNVTATDTQGPGFVGLYPCADSIPNVSNVNFDRTGQSVANFAIIQPDVNGDICMFTPTTTHLIGDEAGVFLDPIPMAVYYEGAPN